MVSAVIPGRSVTDRPRFPPPHRPAALGWASLPGLPEPPQGDLGQALLPSPVQPSWAAQSTALGERATLPRDGNRARGRAQKRGGGARPARVVCVSTNAPRGAAQNPPRRAASAGRSQGRG